MGLLVVFAMRLGVPKSVASIETTTSEMSQTLENWWQGSSPSDKSIQPDVIRRSITTTEASSTSQTGSHSAHEPNTTTSSSESMQTTTTEAIPSKEGPFDVFDFGEGEHVEEAEVSPGEDQLFDFPFDIRVVPDFEQVNQGLIKSEHLPSLTPSFYSQDIYQWSYADVYFNINHIALYDMDPMLANADPFQSWLQKHYGGFLLVNVSLTNTGETNIHIGNHRLQLYLNEMGHPYFSSDSFFPLESGTLNQVMSQTKGIIQPEQTIEGYMVFLFNRKDYQILKEQGYAVMDYQAEEEPIMNSSSSLLNKQTLTKFKDGSHILMPVSTKTQASILEQQSFMADEVSQWWLADKHLLAREDQFDKQVVHPLSLQVQGLELTELTPKQERLDLLRLEPLPKDSVMLSFEYLVSNEEDKPVWFQDQDITLKIQGQNYPVISNSDDATSLHKLEGKGTLRLVQSILIDRQSYQHLRDNQTWNIEMNIPTFMNVAQDSSTQQDFSASRLQESTSQETLEQVNLVPGPNYGFFLKWQPEVKDVKDNS